MRSSAVTIWLKQHLRQGIPVAPLPVPVLAWGVAGNFIGSVFQAYTRRFCQTCTNHNSSGVPDPTW